MTNEEAEFNLVRLSPAVHALRKTLIDFVQHDCIPAEKEFFEYVESQPNEKRWKSVPPVIETLKQKAKSLGLWNLFLPKYYKESIGLTNLEYAVLCEEIGKSFLAPEATNTSAPDTGNMEVLAKYGTDAQKEKWLVPLMNGDIRSAFAMTEPQVASSDATNIETTILLDSKTNEYVINGRKWWISGAGDPRCAIFIVMGKTDPKHESIHKQQSMILVPADTPGIRIIRPMKVFGYDDAPHGHMEMEFVNVRVPAENILLGEGRGFEIAQGRLGPGRIHHCMRLIGIAERAVQAHCARITDPARRTFGKLLAQHGSTSESLALSRCEVDQARFLVLRAADVMDQLGPKKALKFIGMAKYIVPNMAQKVIDRAIQVHGGAGVSQDFFLAHAFTAARTLRIADGPDEVHLMQVAKEEIKSASQARL